MKQEELQRLTAGKKLQSKISKLQGLVTSLPDRTIRLQFLDRSIFKDFESIVGSEYSEEFYNQLKGEIKLLLLSKIADLQEEFDNL